MGNKETNQDVIVVFQAEEEVAVQQVGQRKCPEAGQGPEGKEPFQQYCQIGFILWSTSAGMQSQLAQENRVRPLLVFTAVFPLHIHTCKLRNPTLEYGICDIKSWWIHASWTKRILMQHFICLDCYTAESMLSTSFSRSRVKSFILVSVPLHNWF